MGVGVGVGGRGSDAPPPLFGGKFYLVGVGGGWVCAWVGGRGVGPPLFGGKFYTCPI